MTAIKMISQMLSSKAFPKQPAMSDSSYLCTWRSVFHRLLYSMLWQEKCADGIRTFFFALLHAKRGVFVHALRVRVWGGVPTPRILSCFFKSREKPRSVPPRQGHAFHAMESSRKGDGFILFACTKRTKSTPEVCGPLDSGNGSNRRSKRCFYWNDRLSTSNQLCRNRYFAQYRRQWFEPLQTPSVAQTDMRLCTNSKRILLITVGYDGLRKGDYGVVGMGCFFR